MPDPIALQITCQTVTATLYMQLYPGNPALNIIIMSQGQTRWRNTPFSSLINTEKAIKGADSAGRVSVDKWYMLHYHDSEEKNIKVLERIYEIIKSEASYITVYHIHSLVVKLSSFIVPPLVPTKIPVLEKEKIINILALNCLKHFTPSDEKVQNCLIRDYYLSILEKILITDFKVHKGGTSLKENFSIQKKVPKSLAKIYDKIYDSYFLKNLYDDQFQLTDFNKIYEFIKNTLNGKLEYKPSLFSGRDNDTIEFYNNILGDLEAFNIYLKLKLLETMPLPNVLHPIIMDYYTMPLISSLKL